MTHKDLLYKIQEYHQNTDDNIVGVGYGYKKVNGIITDEKSIVFTVKNKIPKEEVPKDKILPSEININGEILSTDVVKGEFFLLCDSIFYDWQSTPPSNRNKHRPIKGGISVTNYSSLSGYTGTLGFLARDLDSNSLVGVSNNHVLIDDAFICSDRNISGTTTNIKGNFVTQPNETSDSGILNSIGVVKKYYPINLSGYNFVDVALTTINESDIDYNVSYKQEGLSFDQLTFATTEEIDNILVSGTTSYNPLLYSAGRTTGAKGEGVTKLLVLEFPITFSIGYKMQGQTEYITYSDSIAFIATTGSTRPIEFACYYPIAPGDSGSALLADISGTTKIIGLVFAGASDGIGTTFGIACRIDRVAELMNISEWNGEPISFSDTSNILEYSVSGLSDSVFIDYNGSRYWQAGLRTTIS
jgi:hypothetical protein